MSRVESVAWVCIVTLAAAAILLAYIRWGDR